jgi:hypothetical protein
MSKSVEFLNLVGRSPEGGAVQEMCGGLRGPFRLRQGIQHGDQTPQIAESFRNFPAVLGIAKLFCAP